MNGNLKNYLQCTGELSLKGCTELEIELEDAQIHAKENPPHHSQAAPSKLDLRGKDTSMDPISKVKHHEWKRLTPETVKNAFGLCLGISIFLQTYLLNLLSSLSLKLTHHLGLSLLLSGPDARTKKDTNISVVRN